MNKTEKRIMIKMSDIILRILHLIWILIENLKIHFRFADWKLLKVERNFYSNYSVFIYLLLCAGT